MLFPSKTHSNINLIFISHSILSSHLSLNLSNASSHTNLNSTQTNYINNLSKNNKTHKKKTTPC